MTDNLSEIFSALADPTRRKILARLSKKERSVTDLAQPFLSEMSLPAVTKHLKVLEKSGLVIKDKEAQWRYCRLDGQKLKKAADWLEHYCDFWEQSFDRLDDYLKTVTSTKNKRKKP